MSNRQRRNHFRPQLESLQLRLAPSGITPPNPMDPYMPPYNPPASTPPNPMTPCPSQP